MDKQNSSYKQIVKSTSIFGGVQVVNIIIGFIRNKIGALLLGPEGIGIIGMFQNIVDMVRSVSSLGIDTGGIRDIALNSNDKEKQAYSISVYKWWVMLTACLGSLICIIFCYPISIWGFGNSGYAIPVALLSLVIFLTSLSFGQSTILQGLRLITAMAKASLWGNLGGLILSITSYYLWGLKGIVPAFILSSIIILVFTNRYARRINIQKIEIKNNEAINQGISNLKLGLFIVAASIINTLSMFIIRAFLNHQEDMLSVGIFQAAWTISNVYLLLILKSMGSDFYPRLCAVSNYNTQINRLVNEQTYIALVVATPIIVIMILFSKYILTLLYSSEFITGDSLLQWQIAGSFFKIISWPLAFILLAKGKGLYHLLAEALFFVVYLSTSYLLFPYYGLISVGIAYMVSYLIYLGVVLLFGIKLCDFKWSKENKLMTLATTLFVISGALMHLYLTDYLIIAGCILSVISIVYAMIMLNRVFSIKDLINKVIK